MATSSSAVAACRRAANGQAVMSTVDKSVVATAAAAKGYRGNGAGRLRDAQRRNRWLAHEAIFAGKPEMGAHDGI